MNGFRKWLEDQSGSSNGQATVDYVATPSLGQTTTANFAAPAQETEADPTRGGNFTNALIAALEPIDPSLSRRERDGKVNQGFSGTVDYTSPEQAKGLVERVPDKIVDVLQSCVKNFPQMKGEIVRLHRAWMNFRGLLHGSGVYEANHAMLHKIDYRAIGQVDKVLPNADEVIRACRDKQYAKLIQAWNNFYGEWKKVAPALSKAVKNAFNNAEKWDDISL